MIDASSGFSHFARRQLQEPSIQHPGIRALEVRYVLRWIYGARLAVGAALYLGGLLVWVRGQPDPTLLASLVFLLAIAVTAGSFFYTDVYARRPGPTFRYVQSVTDLALVTAVVNVTGGSESEFTALYILVIAAAALLHQARGVVLIATLGTAFHFADALLLHRVEFGLALWLQLGLFAAVALGSGLIGAKLRAQGAMQEALVAELARFRLRDADARRLRARAARLESVAELSASLAHEIKNPLAAIRSAAQQLGEQPQAGDDERSLAGLVTREADRVSRILAEFLEFARMDIPASRTFDVRDIIRQMVELAESHPDRRSTITIETKIPDRPLLVDGDPDVLHRALFNLILNALQVSPDGGLVTVEAESLPARQTPVGEVAFLRGSVAIRVSDRGPGVPDSIADRIFDPFFTTKQRGSGLGLAVVQRSVTAHGGHIVVNSTPTGAQFTVLLPCSPAAAEITARKVKRA